MIAIDYRRDPSTTWEHVCDVHADDLRDHLSSWVGPSLYGGDLVRAVGDGHESLHVWLGSGLWDVRDERGPLTASQWEGEDADAVEMLRRCARVDRRLVVLAACDCAETALQRLPRGVPAGEDRPRRAIETARAWARGQATIAQVRAAAAAAYAAYYAAYAAYAAAAAAYAAAAAAAYAAASAASAAAAAYAAYAAASAASAPSAASARRALAPLVRRHIPLAVVARSIVQARRALAA